MTTNNVQSAKPVLSYDTVAKLFSEEAHSLIPETTIEQILAEEKQRFHNAAILQIAPSKLVGNNTARYCKNLLRKNQPLSFLYFVLCFLSEAAILMLLYGILIGIDNAVINKHSFFTSSSFLYALVFIVSIIACKALFQKHLLDALSIPFSTKTPPEAEIQKRRHSLQMKRLLSLIGTLLVSAVFYSVIYVCKWNPRYTCSVSVWFLLYVGCMLLSGIHNVAYSSHIIPFVTIGSLLLTRRPAEEINAAAAYYLELSYQQILSMSHKTLEDCQNNPLLMDKLRQAIHSRMITARVYYVLALVILIILDIVCICKLRTFLTVALAAFFVCSLLLTAIFILVILSANCILKKTKG